MTKIVNSYAAQLKTDPDSLADQHVHTVYDIGPAVIDTLNITENSCVMFSGSWRFDWNCRYIESNYFKKSCLNYHNNTVFVDHNNTVMLDYLLKKIRPDGIYILHSAMFVAYRNIDLVLKDVKNLGQYTDRVYCTVPTNRIGFNRLTTKLQDLPGKLVDDFLILTNNDC